MKDIFNPQIISEIKARILALTPASQPIWGKMNVAQMLAHCNVSYEMVYSEKHKKPNLIMGMMMKLVVKPIVIGEKPYKKNSRTSPAFKVGVDQDFNKQQARLLEFLDQVIREGRINFEGKMSHSFGRLSAEEWNKLMHKHLDHHLQQFGV